MTVTWNPSDKNANLSLSNGDLTVTDNGPNAQKAIRATQSFTTGKLYWEWTVDVLVTNSHCVGWCDSVQPLNTQIGRSTTGNGWGYHALGRFYHNNTYSSVTSFAQGDVLMFAIDIDAQKLWIGKNGTWEGGGDPATGSNPTADNIDVTPLFPGASTYEATHKGTANFLEASFVYSIPSGFVAVDSSGTVELEDIRLDLAAYYQKTEDLVSFLRAHDGIELHDIIARLEAADWEIEDFAAFLSAYFEEFQDAGMDLDAWGTHYDDFKSFLAAHFENVDDFKTALETWATEYENLISKLEAATWHINNLPAQFSTQAQDLSSFAAVLRAIKYRTKNLSLFLQAHSGFNFIDAALFLIVTDGITMNDMGLKLFAIKNVPTFRSVTAQKVSSVLHEVS